MKKDHDGELKISRERMVELLNEDLAREYQAIIAYVVYSQTLSGAAYGEIAKELEIHATEELSHAIQIANQIDYLGGTPVTHPHFFCNGESKTLVDFPMASIITHEPLIT